MILMDFYGLLEKLGYRRGRLSLLPFADDLAQSHGDLS